MRCLVVRRLIRLGVLLAVLSSLLALPGAAVAQALPTLDGENFVGQQETMGPAEPVCSPDQPVSFSWSSQGVAAGPIPGTYTESGTITMGPEVTFFSGARPVTAWSATFEIVSSDGTVVVTGTKTLGPGELAPGNAVNYAECDPASTVVEWSRSFFVQSDWEATITTPDGTVCESGTGQTGLVYQHHSTLGLVDNFIESFVTVERGPCGPGAPAAVQLSPPTAVNNVGTAHTVTATVTDADAQPPPGIGVTFTVTGSVNATLSCTTDASGECSVTYTGPSLPGADLITGCADSDGNGTTDPGEPCGQATKAWLLPTSTPGHVTGGGHVLNPADGEEVAFGFNVKSDSKGLKGNCTVVDKAPTRDVKIKCLTVDSLVQSGNVATFFGQAEVNGVVTTYRIDVTDNGEPGRNRDTFTIQTGTGYSAGGLLDNGNVQVHNK
jgi:hypothetical protein